MRTLRKLLIAALIVFTSTTCLAIEFKSPKELVEVDLIELRKNAIAIASADEIKIHNQRVLQSLPKNIVNTGRATSISMAYANGLYNSMFMHPVVGTDAVQYQNKDTQIGYCFGRSMYAHLALLKLGLDKKSVLKMWAVGPIKTKTEKWDFHVATIAMGNDGNWIAVDKFAESALPVAKWMAYMQEHSQDGKLLFFVSDPQKFTAELGSYSRLQLGVDLNSGKDWYQGYFKDLLQWFSRDEDALKYFRNFQMNLLN